MRIPRRWSSAVLLVAVAAAAFACREPSSGKPRVAVSIFPLWDITRRIAGDRADVVLVLPPGRSEHAYDPTPKEIARLSGTRLGIAVGLDLDTWVESIMRSAGGGARIVHLGDKVPTLPIELEPIGEGEHEPPGDHDDHDDHDKPGPPGAQPKDDHDDHDDHDKPEPPGAKHEHHERGAVDPHFWTDPHRMVNVVDAIAAELTTLDPAGKDTFTRNAAEVTASLRALDQAVAARAKAWTRRTIVTFHGSMAYYARRYDLRIAAVVEPLAGREPTAQYLTEVLTAIKRSGAAALFSEPQLDRRPAEVIAREAGIPLGELDPVGGVAGRDRYEALITWNTDQLESLLK